MQTAARFLGVDLGASSGRVTAGQWDGRRFQLEELHRFPNAGIRIADRIYWDVLNIWTQILGAFRHFSAEHAEGPTAIGLDAWGVDFGLLDKDGRLLANPVHYRDRRTEGVSERLFKVLDEASMFRETGVQSWRINTLFQLYSMVLVNDQQLEMAHTLLTIPDLFSYFLCGTKAIEFTEATTTQMYSFRSAFWATDLIRSARIPAEIMPMIIQPCSHFGTVRPSVLQECRFSGNVPVIATASHDTASAVAAIPDLGESSFFISSGTWSLVGTQVAAPNTSVEAYRLGFTNEGAANGMFLLLKNLAGLWIIQECIRCWEIGGHSYGWNEVIEAAVQAPALRSLIDPNDKAFELPLDMPMAVQEYCVRTRQPVADTVGGVARAVFEGLALSYRDVLVTLERLTGQSLTTIRIVGGGSQNALLSQMVADACGRKVVTGPTEATLLGNVMVQAIATGHIGDLQQGKARYRRVISARTL